MVDSYDPYRSEESEYDPLAYRQLNKKKEEPKRPYYDPNEYQRVEPDPMDEVQIASSNFWVEEVQTIEVKKRPVRNWINRLTRTILNWWKRLKQDA